MTHDSSKRTSWRVLRQREFRLYFAGSLASNAGTWLQNTAQVILVYRLTHSVFAVGLVSCAQFSGSLVLGPSGPMIASRLGGTRLLVATQLACAGIAGWLAALQAAGRLTELPLVLGALGLGLAFAFALPVQTALVPGLVAEADTGAAMAMNSVSYNAGRALAPALCVAVVLGMGFTWAFLLNSMSFVVFACVLFWLRPPGGPTPAWPARATDGLVTALRHPRILLLLCMVAAVTFADDPVLVLGPGLARHVLGTSSDWAGYFLSALGCGTILGSLRPARTHARQQPESTSATSRVAALGLLVLGGAIILFAAGIAPWLSLAAALAAGAAGLVAGSTAQAMLARYGRGNTGSVMALWAIAWAGTKPLASLTDGWIASRGGILAAGVAMVTPAMLLALFEMALPARTKRHVKAMARAHGTRYLEMRPGLHQHIGGSPG